jgi:serine/threonine-protein phosphatase 4 regulatory subunit 1
LLKKDPKKWRIRLLIARQIDRLAKIYQSETVFRIISPISFKLCNDPVSLVREKAAKKIYAVFLAIKDKNKEEDIYQKCIIESIKGFSVSNRFNQRQA